jgi:hypothetical protein
MSALWQALSAYQADVVVAGREPGYERFGLLSPTGAEQAGGIREFVVGTGGGLPLAKFPPAPLPGSQARNAETYGLLKLTLAATSYHWQFVPEPGQIYFSDSGDGNCH